MSNNSSTDKEKIGFPIADLEINSETFGGIYDLYVKSVYRFIYFKVNSREEAEDLTSETFLKTWHYISKSEKSKKINNLKAFLYQTASNLVVDFYRKKALLPFPFNPADNEANIADQRLSDADAMEKDDEARALKKALKNIPENYCDIIVWYYLEDAKISEISKIIEKSEGAVRVLIHRALKSLKREMEKIEMEEKDLVEKARRFAAREETIASELLNKVSSGELSEQTTID